MVTWCRLIAWAGCAVVEFELSVHEHVLSPAQRRRILKSEQFRDSRLVVTSYNTLMRDQDELAKFTWGFVVLDEGHAIAGGAKVTPFLRSLRWC